jgi:asparagine synthase (glutamine-hydrolysing)
MTLLGGWLYRDRARRVEAPWLKAHAARATGQTAVEVLATGPLGLWVAKGKPPRRQEPVAAAADLDLVNMDELRALTGLAGACPVLARLYELEGWQGVRHLRGAFALALWDERRQSLCLAVDHFGMRRLYWTMTPEALLWATRASLLRAFPGVQAGADPAALYHYLNFGYVPAPQSAFAGIRRLPPGHVLLAQNGEPCVRRYWDLAYPERRLGLREGRAALAEATREAVEAALGGTTPKETGAFLSGGTDSSTVVGLMGRITGERAQAFSIGFQEERWDELGYAELAARHFQAAHYTRVAGPREAREALPALVEAYDEPFGNDSAVGTFLCARLARECGVTTLLAGDGGDEIFGGNQHYVADRIFARYQVLPAPLRRGLLEPLLRTLPEDAPGLLGRAQRYVRRASIPNPRRAYSYRFFFAQEGRSLLGPALARGVDPEGPWTVLEEQWEEAQAESELNRLLYLDIKLIIGDNDLLKVTRTAELAGVRVRFPFLDRRLVEFMATVPARLKVRGLQKRYLFKRAFADLLPPEILAKPKHGFGVPVSAWLRTDPAWAALAREALTSRRARERGWLARGAAERLFTLNAGDPTPFYGDILWTALMLELWAQRHLDRRR